MVSSSIPAGNNAIYSGALLYYLNNPQFKELKVKIKIDFRVRSFSPSGALGYFRIFHDYVIPVGSNLETYFIQELEYDNFASNGIWKNYSIDYEQTFDLVQLGSLGIRIQPYFSGSYLQANQMDFEFSKVEDLQENDEAKLQNVTL